MRRVRDGDLRADPNGVVYDSEIEAIADRFLGDGQGGRLDAVGWRRAEIDPIAHEKRRKKQRIYLAFYGHQPLFSWDDVEVTELQEYHDGLSAFIQELNDAREQGGSPK